jgi:hypothetical protein
MPENQQGEGVKATFDLPSDLVRALKLKAVHENRRLKEVVTDLLRSAVEQEASTRPVPERGPIEVPFFATNPGAPASQMSADALIALEQAAQLEEDHARNCQSL